MLDAQIASILHTPSDSLLASLKGLDIIKTEPYTMSALPCCKKKAYAPRLMLRAYSLRQPVPCSSIDGSFTVYHASL